MLVLGVVMLDLEFRHILVHGGQHHGGLERGFGRYWYAEHQHTIPQ